jgi:hypothetical protein
MVDAVASQPEKHRPISLLRDFKIADPQYILSVDPAATVEEMENAIWQQIGGHEIISIIRRDLIDGTNPNYSIISDLEKLNKEYNSKTIVPIEGSAEYFANSFGIKFERYLPASIYLSELPNSPTNPVDVEETEDSYNVVIYVADIPSSYEIEVQTLSAREVFRDTIYEGENYQS